MEQDVFLGLSSTAWSAISSIATVLAVFVALFIPFYYESKRKRNIDNILECELFENYKLLKKAQQCNDGNFRGQPISKIQLMCLVLNTLSVECWKENKKSMAEMSKQMYAKYSEVNSFIEDICKHSNEIIESKLISSYASIIEKEVDLAISKIEKLIKKRMLTIASTMTTRPVTQSAN